MPLEPTHAAREAALAAALLDPAASPPPGLLGRDGGPVGRRLAVHRATSTFGLIGALSTRFPVLERLLGAETFADLARAFVAVDRPATALLLEWGDGLPDFVDGLADLAEWPFLADVARLEIAWSRAHHAAEATPLGLADLGRLDAERLATARLRLHPSLSLVASPHPIASIFLANQGEEDTGEIDWVAERVLVVRPDADVHLHRIEPGAHAFVAALAGGDTITAAALAASRAEPAFDAGGALIGLVRLGAVIGLDPLDPSE